MTEKFMVPVELPGDATSALHAVPKQQLDPSNSQLAILAAQMEVRRLADLGYFAVSNAAFPTDGLKLSPNATPTKLDMAAGVGFMSTTSQVAAAQTAISTTIASLEDATNPKWVVVELDSSNVVQFNQGTAAASPVFPTITVTRIPLGFLYVPSSAVNTAHQVDTALGTANNLAKLIDARNVRRPQVRQVFAVENDTTVSNPTAALTALYSTGYTIPANSLSVHDRYRLKIFGTTLIGTSSTFQIAVRIGASAVAFNYITTSLTNSANPRDFVLECDIIIKAVGASADAVAGGRLVVTAAALNTATVQETDGGGAAGDRAAHARTALSATFDSTASQLLNVLVRIATGGTCNAIGSGSIEKIPAP